MLHMHLLCHSSADKCAFTLLLPTSKSECLLNGQLDCLVLLKLLRSPCVVLTRLMWVACAICQDCKRIACGEKVVSAQGILLSWIAVAKSSKKPQCCEPVFNILLSLFLSFWWSLHYFISCKLSHWFNIFGKILPIFSCFWLISQKQL